MLSIDGSVGEGGGQILRTSLSLSALTGRPFRLTNIRTNRPKPGLRPQHLTAVRAAAAICNAELSGDNLNSTNLEFWPQTRPLGGKYSFDVSDAATGGSAGSVSLIFQSLLIPLLFADAPSHLTLAGGTHVPYSPPYHYLAEVTRPALTRLGANFSTKLNAWGWYPQGGGIMTAVIEPITQLTSATFDKTEGKQVKGIAAVTNLPSHIPQRMVQRAHNLLVKENFHPVIQALRETGRGPGAGIVLWTHNGGFTSLGRKGLSSEKVAESAVNQFLTFLETKSGVDKYLADQLLLPLALAHGRSSLTTEQLTQHTLTNATLLRQWLEVSIEIIGEHDQSAEIHMNGVGFSKD